MGAQPKQGPHQLEGRAIEEGSKCSYMRYRCAASSVDGFVKQVAVQYLRHGYWFYKTGWIPEGKDPERVEEKLMAMYGIDVPPWRRCRMLRSGGAAVHLVRHGRFFVLMATKGHQQFMKREGRVLDMRRTALVYQGYDISYRRSFVTGRGHPSVRIHRSTFLELRSSLVRRAQVLSEEEAAWLMRRVPFYPYAPVRRQLMQLLRAVNAARKSCGNNPVRVECLRLQPWGVRF